MEKVKFIELYKGRGHVIVDEKRFDELVKHRWTLSTVGYAMRSLGRGNYQSMHSYLMPVAAPLITDHIDGDQLDNRESNLRAVTKAQNAMNSKIFSHNKSGHKGVCRHKNGRWRAFIMVNQRQIHLGHFKKMEDAIAARKQGEEKYFGEFARRA